MTVNQLRTCEFESDKLLVKFESVIPADRRAVVPLVETVMHFLRGMSCARGKEFEVELALHEALVNAVVHGCKLDPSKEVQICIACDESRGILIVVRDPGAGFSPEQIPSPVIGENIFALHGRGIYLINQLMDEVSFERGGTVIRMRKRSAETPD